MNPRYDIYIVSKGRADTRLTSKALEKMGVPYQIVIEPQEYDQYAAVIDPKKILVTPFSNLGQGSIPARNFAWEHSISAGARRFWLVDDNIRRFARLHQNMKRPVGDETAFRCMEDFVDRYSNIALAGPQYWGFAPRKREMLPFSLNTRVYSCILIDNSIPYRFRGRWNEDTDLSIRALKDGWCTVLFNAFLQDKATTMTMRGGNTESLYAGDGRLKMAHSLQMQHPDVVTVTKKFGRFQHQVDYRPFKDNELIPRPDAEIPDVPPDYGMVLRTVAASASGEPKLRKKGEEVT